MGLSKVYHHREVHNTDEEVHVTVATVLETYPEIGQEQVVAAVAHEEAHVLE